MMTKLKLGLLVKFPETHFLQQKKQRNVKKNKKWAILSIVPGVELENERIEKTNIPIFNECTI